MPSKSRLIAIGDRDGNLYGCVAFYDQPELVAKNEDGWLVLPVEGPSFWVYRVPPKPTAHEFLDAVLEKLERMPGCIDFFEAMGAELCPKIENFDVRTAVAIGKHVFKLYRDGVSADDAAHVIYTGMQEAYVEFTGGTKES